MRVTQQAVEAPSTSAAPSSGSGDTFRFDGKYVDFDRLELYVRDQVFPLTLMEANVLRYLIRHEGKHVSRKALLSDVWGLHEDTDTRAIDNFIVRLRRYIEDDATKPRHLQTVRGVGYRFVASPPGMMLTRREWLALASAAVPALGEELAAGTLLVATRNSHDPDFAESVILLIHYSAQGAVGLMINRPWEDVPITRLFPELKRSPVKLWQGGPIAIGVRALLRSRTQPEQADSARRRGVRHG